MYRHKVSAYLNTLEAADTETRSPPPLNDDEPSGSGTGRTSPLIEVPSCADLAPCLKVLAKMEQIKVPQCRNEQRVDQTSKDSGLGDRLLSIIQTQRQSITAFKYINAVLQQLQHTTEKRLRKRPKRKVRRRRRPVAPETSSSSAFEELSTANSTDSQPFDDIHIHSDIVSQSPLVQYPQRVDGMVPMVVLGPNGTQIAAMFFDELDWSSPVGPTRTLLSAVFHSEILAAHTLTGKPSPAFRGRLRPRKLALDAKKTSDIIYCVRKRTGVSEREIRNIITTKCSEAAKKLSRDSGSNSTSS